MNTNPLMIKKCPYGLFLFSAKKSSITPNGDIQYQENLALTLLSPFVLL